MTPANVEDRLFDGIARRAPGDDAVTRRVARLLGVSPEARVLDVAAGTSLAAPLLAAMGAHVVAIDRDAAALDRVSRAVRDAGVGALVELVHGDELSAELGADLFDAAICEGALQRLGGPLSFLRRFAPHVKVGGGLAFTVLCQVGTALPSTAGATLGQPRRPAEVLLDLVHAGLEPLSVEVMPDDALATYREALARNADAILAGSPDPALAMAAREARRRVDALREADGAVAEVAFVGRKLDASGLSPNFRRPRGGA